MNRPLLTTIVWATDGSATAGRCRRELAELCRHDGASLRIVHVASQRPGETVVAELKAQTRMLRDGGINASLHVIRGAVGPPGPHIVDVARAVGAGLLVVSGADDMVQPLLAAGVCPVLVWVDPERSDDGRSAGPESLAAAA